MSYLLLSSCLASRLSCLPSCPASKLSMPSKLSCLQALLAFQVVLLSGSPDSVLQGVLLLTCSPASKMSCLHTAYLLSSKFSYLQALLPPKLFYLQALILACLQGVLPTGSPAFKLPCQQALHAFQVVLPPYSPFAFQVVLPPGPPDSVLQGILLLTCSPAYKIPAYILSPKLSYFQALLPCLPSCPASRH